MKRREFFIKGAMIAGSIALGSCGSIEAEEHRYKLASESLLPSDIKNAPNEVRESYRFAIANRETLRYIPCYCGCGEQGHTSNASCYFTDNSTPKKPVFDRMSLA